MTRGQSIVSAGAENRKARMGRARRRILTASLTACLILPSLAAWGSEGAGAAATSGRTFETISLPRVPYLDSVPWLNWRNGGDTFKVDTLRSPILDPSGIKL